MGNFFLWKILKRFRKDSHNINRSRVVDSLIVIGVKQAMLIGMLSAEDDSSSSESEEEYYGNSFESMRDVSLELPSSSSTNPCLPLLQENRDECHSVSPTSSNSQRGRLVRYVWR